MCVFEKSSAQSELCLKQKEQRNKYTFSWVKISHLSSNSPVATKKWVLDESTTWKSIYIDLGSLPSLAYSYFLQKFRECKGKNRTTSRWNPNLYQVTLFHCNGFFKATPNPPICCAEKARDESQDKNVNDKNNQTITEEHDKSFVPKWRSLASWTSAQE